MPCKRHLGPCCYSCTLANGRVKRLTAAARPPLLFDYLRLPATELPVALIRWMEPALASRLLKRLQRWVGWRIFDSTRGLDHGVVFVPASLLFPRAHSLSCMSTLEFAGPARTCNCHHCAADGRECADVVRVLFSFHTAGVCFDPVTRMWRRCSNRQF